MMQTETLTIYEIINPSDPYTLRAADEAVACVACLFLGEGAYGLEREDGTRGILPPFLFGGDPDKWLHEKHGVSIDDIATGRRSELADVLDSVLIGSLSAREEFERACAKMTPEAAAEYRAEYHDRKRTSMNNIGRRATSLAEHFRKPKGEE